MKKMILLASMMFCSVCLAACSDDDNNGKATPVEPTTPQELAVRNLSRAIALVDTTVAHYFSGTEMKMARYYNPYTGTTSTETGSVWMYTSAIESVNSVLEGLNALKTTSPKLYEDNYNRFTELLSQLYDKMSYYAGTHTLTSYTQTKEWTVYGVNRGSEPGHAEVAGVMDVYDDQEWIIRELLRSYQITGQTTLLEKAEYLTDYVLDGWDCGLDAAGNEVGGITWGPGYVTKHACSNAPMISPLVWLHNIYNGKSDQITYRKIAADGSRYTVTTTKSDYYLAFARKIYTWQKQHLLMSEGVYYDLIGATAREPQYEEVGGVRYRKSLGLTAPSGKAYTYNSGTMVSGGADLYGATQDGSYLADLKALNTATFSYFATKDEPREGYYGYPIDGFSTWFNDVLMRGYLAAYSSDPSVSTALKSFQDNLDFGYANFLYKGLLPTNVLVGWSWSKGNNNTEGMFEFAFASEYAMLAKYQATQSSLNK